MNPARDRPSSGLSPSAKWSAYAGAYMFACAAALLLLLSPLSNFLIQLLGQSTEYSAFSMAGPTAVIGAVVWWAIVERRSEFGYLSGGISGLLTAFLTVLFWLLRFVSVWGVPLVLTGKALILFVLAVTLPVAFIAGLPLIYARRRLDDGLPTG